MSNQDVMLVKCWVKIKMFLLLGFLIWSSSIYCQSGIDHWETVVSAEDNWRYFIGTSEPSTGWPNEGINDNDWEEGPGGIGYGDDDDNTIIPNTMSVFMRRDFELIDTSLIEMAVLHADYDDAFVAYLNGVEISRANIGTQGLSPAFNQSAYLNHEAALYQGGLPEEFPIFKSNLKSLIKEGSNTLAIQVHNRDINSSDLSAIFYLSMAINDASQNYDPTPGWFYEPFNSSNLPLVIINTNGQSIPDEPRIVANMGIVDNGPGNRNFITSNYNDYNGKIAIEIRGASSQMFPKKNYSIETQDQLGENLNVSLLGMPEENDWVLHGPYSDKSFLRNVITFHIGRQTGHYAPRTRLCELLINDQYLGIYVLMERIKRDNNRVDIANLKPEDIEGDELSGGYIFQIDRDRDDIDDGWFSNFTPNPFYAYDDPDFDELVPEQKEYLQNHIASFEQAMLGSDYRNRYRDFIDVSSFVDYFLVSELSKHIDVFKLSFFMYKKKDSNGGKIHFGPLWDINLGYGNFDFGCNPDPEGWIYLCTASPRWINRLLSIPAVRDQLGCRWDSLRQDILHINTLNLYIDENVDLLDEARQRNFARWPVIGNYVWPNDFIGQSYEEEVDFLKQWINNRLEWMDSNMFGTGNCDLVGIEEQPNSQVQFTTFPNPASQTLHASLQLDNKKRVNIKLMDALGREQKIFFSERYLAPGLHEFKWEIHQETTGFYFLHAHVGEDLMVRKIVINN